MSEVIVFSPRAELDAEENLRAFIDMCRNQLTVFGYDLPFDRDIWDVTAALNLKARSGATRAVFSSWMAVNDRVPAMMSEPFKVFAKAYFRYQHGMRPTKAIGQRLAALRALEAALTENGDEGSPVRADASVFNRAAQLTNDQFTKAVAYRVGGQLELIADFLSDNHLSIVPLQWKHPIQRPRDTVRVGKEFDERRMAKLPSPAALNAVAKSFHIATDPADVLVSSIAAILCSAPDRINEVLLLAKDCEVRQKRGAKGDECYGLRWWPAKNAEPMVKWIIPSMSGVVQGAIARIRMLTEQARLIASWYEKHPDQMFLSEEVSHLRQQQLISMNDVAAMLFSGPVSRGTPREWCKSNNVPILNRSHIVARFADVEAAVLKLLPKDFPFVNRAMGLKYSEALCVIQRNGFHLKKATYRCAIQAVTQQHVSDGLGARPESSARSIFDRLGFREDDQSPIRISTHQFRHYLNTLAQSGGMSQLDIAKWSGRKDVKQNATYDHQSDRDVLAMVREAIEDEQGIFGPLAALPKARLIPRDEFARLKAPTAHTTEFGYCLHDYSMSPCQIHRDCVNCDEQVCVKGDAVKEANIRRHRDETRTLLEAAQDAMQQEYVGANRWAVHQSSTLARLEQLCTILDDPSVPIGAVIQLAGVVPASRVQQAESGRNLAGTNVDSAPSNDTCLPLANPILQRARRKGA